MARRPAHAAMTDSEGPADSPAGEHAPDLAGANAPKSARRKRAASVEAASSVEPKTPRAPKAPPKQKAELIAEALSALAEPPAASRKPPPEPKPAAVLYSAPKPAPVGAAPSLAELVMSSSGADLEKLSANLTEAVMRANSVLSSSLQNSNAGSFRMDPFDAQSAVSEAMTSLATHPEVLAEAQAALWMRYTSIWQEHATRWMSGGAEPETNAKTDKRFRDPEWQGNPYFALLKDTYLATAEWITGLIDRADGLDEATKRKAGFFIKQAVDAASPSNFLMTNPAALRATLQSNGENLVKGLQNLSDDIERGHGTLAIRQTDLDAFTVGENVATAPGKVVFRNELLELIQYAPTTETVHEIPLLIFAPCINKWICRRRIPSSAGWWRKGTPCSSRPGSIRMCAWLRPASKPT